MWPRQPEHISQGPSLAMFSAGLPSSWRVAEASQSPRAAAPETSGNKGKGRTSCRQLGGGTLSPVLGPYRLWGEGQAIRDEGLLSGTQDSIFLSKSKTFLHWKCSYSGWRRDGGTVDYTSTILAPHLTLTHLFRSIKEPTELSRKT